MAESMEIMDDILQMSVEELAKTFDNPGANNQSEVQNNAVQYNQMQQNEVQHDGAHYNDPGCNRNIQFENPQHHNGQVRNIQYDAAQFNNLQYANQGFNLQYHNPPPVSAQQHVYNQNQFANLNFVQPIVSVPQMNPLQVIERVRAQNEECPVINPAQTMRTPAWNVTQPIVPVPHINPPQVFQQVRVENEELPAVNPAQIMRPPAPNFIQQMVPAPQVLQQARVENEDVPVVNPAQIIGPPAPNFIPHIVPANNIHPPQVLEQPRVENEVPAAANPVAQQGGIRPNVDRPVPCPECPMRFRREADMKKHFRVHTDAVLSVPCPECDRTFCDNGALNLHTLGTHKRQKRAGARSKKGGNSSVAPTPEDEKDGAAGALTIAEEKEEGAVALAPEVEKDNAVDAPTSVVEQDAGVSYVLITNQDTGIPEWHVLPKVEDKDCALTLEEEQAADCYIEDVRRIQNERFAAQRQAKRPRHE